MPLPRTPSPFPRRPALVGMVHLPPLPGSPGWQGSMDAVLSAVAADVTALHEAGVHGVMVENFGDVPFLPDRVGPATVAALTRAVAAARQLTDRPVGVNVLRNDARSALGIAAATGAAFLRVNVHSGAMHTDQGLIQGRAGETLRLRASLGIRCAIWADVHVKHATPVSGESLETAARDTWARGRADALIVSGSGTGRPTDPDRIRRVREAVPEAPIWVGSGVDPETLASLPPASPGSSSAPGCRRTGERGAVSTGSGRGGSWGSSRSAGGTVEGWGLDSGSCLDPTPSSSTSAEGSCTSGAAFVCAAPTVAAAGSSGSGCA